MANRLTGKIKITFKHPDAICDAIEDFLEQQRRPDVDKDEWDAIVEHRRKKIKEVCSRWFEYGEYVRLELDLGNDTCQVIKARK